MFSSLLEIESALVSHRVDRKSNGEQIEVRPGGVTRNRFEPNGNGVRRHFVSFHNS